MIKVMAKQRRELQAVVGRAAKPAGLVRRTRVVLLSAAGEAGRAIAARLAPTPEQSPGSGGGL